MQKITFSVLSVFLTSAVIVFLAAEAQAYPCLSGTITSLGGNGQNATISVTNAAGCSAKTVSFCSYRLYIANPNPGWLATQTLFGSTTVNIAPGETRSLAVKTDVCQNQIDAFEGACINPFASDNVSIPTIFAGQLNLTGPLCVACVDKCTEGARECAGNGYRICGKAANGCFDWTVTECADNQICSGGNCILKCTDECSNDGERVCSGNGWKQCGNFDTDSCKEWGPITDCGINKTCKNGSCDTNKPTVDLNVSGTVACNRNATLAWNSNNADSCSASGGWSGSKTVNGTESVGNFTGSKTFKITCSNAGGEASDSVTINGEEDRLNASAGSDMDVDAGESIRLNGSIDGDGFGGEADITWSCAGGDLSNRNTLRPTFRADEDDDRTYTCTMTAKNDCGSDSDSMKVAVNKKTSNFKVSLTARPDTDCAPINDADLVAKLSNYSNNDHDYTYYFDCENDGDWDKTVTTDDTTYTAANLCDYRNVGSYTAKVKVTSNGRTVTDTAIVRANRCEEERKEIGQVGIVKNVRNVSGGTGYQGTVSANPGETVSYRIIVTGISGEVDNVIVSDALPGGITNVRDLMIDGINRGGNLGSGINLGSLATGQTRTITYAATVAGAQNFSYGQTILKNVATVIAGGESANSNAVVQVYRQTVKSATTVSTGFGGNMFAGIGLGAAGSALSLGWLMIRAYAKRKITSEELLARKISSIKQNSLA